MRLVDLSTHRSGLPKVASSPLSADFAKPNSEYSIQDLYGFLLGYAPTPEVGAKYEYSELGVGLLGHLLENRTGTDYESLLRNRIFEPLGMEMTGIEPTPEMLARLVQGHRGGEAVSHTTRFLVLRGAGALRSNAEDMLDFLAANVGTPTSGLESAMRESHKPRALANYQNRIGLGWHIMPVGSNRVVWHNGSTGGFSSFIGFDPKRGVGVVMLSNSAQSFDDIGLHLITGAPLSSDRRFPIPALFAALIAFLASGLLAVALFRFVWISGSKLREVCLRLSLVFLSLVLTFGALELAVYHWVDESDGFGQTLSGQRWAAKH
jgi:CubicO group peptidase (beta-lactamase class C family)